MIGAVSRVCRNVADVLLTSTFNSVRRPLVHDVAATHVPIRLDYCNAILAGGPS